MREKAPQTTGQESLIIAEPLTGEFAIHDFGENWPAVSLKEHYLQQIHVLNMFSTLHEKEALIRDPNKLKRQYPKAHVEVLAAIRNQWQQLQEEAKTEFFRSLGYYAVKDSGQVNDEELAPYTKDAQRRWSLFQARYRSVPKAPARYAEIERLVAEVKDTVEGRTLYNRTHELRPHASDKKKVRRNLEDEQPAVRPLTTRERLIALQEDPRAGYIPANNREKNTLLAWLDYFDNPKWPLGIGNQLFEVLVHQQKERTHLDGIRAVESITWEVGDYLADAVMGYELLTRLHENLEGILPSAQLTKVEGLEPEALAYLFRFEAIERLLQTDSMDSSLSDPLLVTEDRWVKGGIDPGKHKTVYSHFNAPDNVRPANTDEYIYARQATMSVARACRLLKKAIPNEYTRAAVMIRCLADIHNSLTGEYDVLGNPVDTAISESLAVVRDNPIVQLILNERAKHAA